MKFEVQNRKLNEARYYIGDARKSIERCYQILCDACDYGVFENGKFKSIENNLINLKYETRIEKRECELLETGLNEIISIYSNIENGINKVTKGESSDSGDEKE